MHLNTLKPAPGSRPAKKRVGRGIGSGKGKTCGMGHKGQKARSGAGMMIGFEGGQTPLQWRVPKFGFVSRKSLVSDEIRLHELNKFDGRVDMDVLHKSGLIASTVKFVKVVATGKLEKAIELVGIKTTAAARQQIEAAGGKVVDA
jgi:large subunit ribosomal protein L15